MTPADYILAAATTALAGTGTFLRQSAEQAGIKLNKTPLPAIVLYDYTTAQASTSSRVQSAPITLYFGDARPGKGDNPAAHQAAVARMEALKQRFFAALDAKPLAQIDAMKATPFANAYAATLDGVGVQFTLTVPAASLVEACL